MAKENQIEMEIGKIYFISFGGGTQLVIRFKESDTCNHLFFDSLHYWNGHQTFHSREAINYCVKNGIEEIRRATMPEKHALIKFELDNNCI